jgi:hypothetical protein
MAVTTPITLPTTREDRPGYNLPDTATRWAAFEANAVIGAILDRATYRGIWNIATQYYRNNIVTHNSVLYNALLDSVGSTPPSANWEAITQSAAVDHTTLHYTSGTLDIVTKWGNVGETIKVQESTLTYTSGVLTR